MMILFFFSILISSISQIMLKIGSKNVKNLYINKYTIGGYTILIISTICTATAYREIELSTGVLLETLSYIFVPLLSHFFLGEKMTKRRIVGMLIIIIGIIIFSM